MVHVDTSAYQEIPVSFDVGQKASHTNNCSKEENFKVNYLDRGEKGVFPVVGRIDKNLWTEKTKFSEKGSIVERGDRYYEVAGKDVRQLKILERVINVAKGLLLSFFTDARKYFKNTSSRIFVTPVEPKDTVLPSAKLVSLGELKSAFTNFNKAQKSFDERIQKIEKQSHSPGNLWIFDAKEQKKILDLTKQKIELCKNFIQTPLNLNPHADKRTIDAINQIYQKYQNVINYYASIEEKTSAYNKENNIVPDTKNLNILKSYVSELQENYEKRLFKEIEGITKEALTLLNN